jgi:anaerobic magnesium-protoporphyrin IX monomethyl ester cyclase
MRVLFVTPPYHAGVVEVAGRWVPMYFVTLTGSLRAAGHDAVIYDAMTKFVGFEEIGARIEEFKPHVVCTTAITCTSPDAIKVVELAKAIDPRIVTVCGGIHASFMYGEMFSLTRALDYVCVGEGEETLVELMDALASGGNVARVRGVAYREGTGVRFTGKRPYIKDLDALPMAWDALEWADYTYFIYPGSRLGALDTSRGCEKDCTFCSQQKFWEQTWRQRSPEGIVREMERQARDHGVDVLLFTDDYPSPNRENWERMLDLLIERDLGIRILMETRVGDILRDRDILDKYVKAGIAHIYVGTESPDQKTLDLMKKDITVAESKEALRLLHDVGIITETSMIFGFPDDTNESIEQMIEMAREYNPDFAHFLAIAPWPYADMYKDLEPYIVDRDYRKYNLIDPVVKPKNMTIEEIDMQIINGYRSFYMTKFMGMDTDADDHRTQYLMRAMKRMMSSSFIVRKLGMLDEMPDEIRRIMESKRGEG